MRVFLCTRTKKERFNDTCWDNNMQLNLCLWTVIKTRVTITQKLLDTNCKIYGIIIHSSIQQRIWLSISLQTTPVKNLSTINWNVNSFVTKQVIDKKDRNYQTLLLLAGNARFGSGQDRYLLNQIIGDHIFPVSKTYYYFPLRDSNFCRNEVCLTCSSQWFKVLQLIS